jgi:hypothetical protein
MGLIEKIFKRPRDVSGGYFTTGTAYSPVFTSWDGQLYENGLVRSAIDARARHISKLQVTIPGTAKNKIRTRLRNAPNEWMTWSKFLYRLSTILDMQNSAFIVPVVDDYGETVGIFPVLPSNCALVEHAGELWIRYKFRTGQTAAVPFKECALMTRHQYGDDFFGDKNTALGDTMKLMHLQAEGIREAVKNSNTDRFMAKVTNFTKASDLKKERQQFTAENLRGEGDGGVLLFPNTYADIRQIVGKPYVVDADQIKQIRENVFDYFGVNSKILQNSATGDEWNAFYEGVIEPFAIQFSEVLTKMLFTFREQGTGNRVMATSNRLQYLSNKDKLEVTRDLLDRGIITQNQAMEIWNLPPVEGGDVRIIRGEYYTTDEKLSLENEEGENNNG